MKEQIKKSEETKKPRPTPAVSARPRTGEVAEMLYQPRTGRTVFLRCRASLVEETSSITLENGQVLVPYSAANNLITHGVLLLPSGAAPYGSEASLLDGIRSFIHRHVDLSPDFETLSAYYILFSWVYDDFNELPYLRVRGDYGTGKSRFLLTIGSLCYKPIFASGASSVSPLFRMIDAVRGTLVLDEGDFRLSDERAEIIKILNNGNARGFPVLRSEATPTGEYNPRAFVVFGPKVLATRRSFEDRALESRCITEDLGGRRLRKDIPINLTLVFEEEAGRLRNQLLQFRFDKCGQARAEVPPLGTELEPRIRQILSPLLSTISDPIAREKLATMASRLNQSLAVDRGMALEAELLEVIRNLRKEGGPLSLARIAQSLSGRFSPGFQAVSPRWVGSMLRSRLNLEAQKSHGIYVIDPSNYGRLDSLLERYGLAERVDLGDLGDIGEDGRRADGPEFGVA